MLPQPDFIHVGMPKAGSTWLQTGLFRHHPELRVYGQSLSTAPVALNALPESIQMLDKDIESKHWLGDAPDAIPRDGKLLGLSNEDLSGNVPNGMPAIPIADRMRQLFPGSLKIVFIARNPLTYFSSAFYQTVASGIRTESITEYWKHHRDVRLRNVVKRLNYAEIIGHYKQLFGDAQVLVLPYELLRDSEAAFVDHITDFLGVKPYALAPSSEGGARRNERLSGFAYGTLVQANRVDVLIRRITRSERRIFNRTIVGFFRRTGFTSQWAKPADMPPSAFYAIPEFDALLRDENYALWTGDLAKYNYTFPR